MRFKMMFGAVAPPGEQLPEERDGSSQAEERSEDHRDEREEEGGGEEERSVPGEGSAAGGNNDRWWERLWGEIAGTLDGAGERQRENQQSRDEEKLGE